MDNHKTHVDLTLPELISLFWSKKFFIISLTFCFAVAAAITSLLLTPIYVSSAQLSASSLGSAQQQSRNSVGSIATIIGMSPVTKEESDTSTAIAVLQSREFAKRLSSKYDILPDLLAAKSFNKNSNETSYDKSIYDPDSDKWLRPKFQPYPTYLQAHEIIQEIVNINLDDDTGFIIISVSHLSPLFCKYLIEIMVSELNLMTSEKEINRSRESISFLKAELSGASELEIRQSISVLLESQLRKQMIASVKKNYLLEYIDPPFLPELRTHPRRTVITIFVSMIGFFLSISIVWIKFYYTTLLRQNSSS